MKAFFNTLRFVLVVLVTFFLLQLQSQNVINMNNKGIIIAESIVITPNTIKYTIPGADIDTLTINKNEVKSIVYRDGSHIEFKLLKKNFNILNLGSNIIGFHMLDFVISNFTFSYERIINNGKMGIQFPLSIGYRKTPTEITYPLPMDTWYHENKLVNDISVGVNLNLYPTGQGRVKFITGPGIIIGSGKYFPDGNNNNPINPKISTAFTKLIVNNGLVISPVNSLSIYILGSIGIQYMFAEELKKAETTGALSLNLSLRF